MDTFTAIRERRSIKHYDPDHQMPEEAITQLLELAMLSPTSFNIQNWRFVVVTDPAKKAAIRAVSWNQAQVTDASLTILLCANLEAHRNAARYWVDAPQAVQDIIIPAVGPFYDGNVPLKRDEAMRSVGIAAQTLMLAAKAMGYDSCPMIGFDPEKVGEIINLPGDHLIGMMVTVGKAIRPANARAGQLPMDEVVFRNEFPA